MRATAIPTLFLVAYKLPSGEFHLAVRSDPKIAKVTHCIMTIDNTTDSKWLSMIATETPSRQLIPAELWSIVLSLHNPQPTDSSNKINYHPAISQARQFDYLQTLARLLQPTNYSAAFFAHAEEQELTDIEFDILTDAVLNADQVVAEFILSKLTRDQLINALTRSTDKTKNSEGITLFQIALSTTDVDMAKMIKSHFVKLENEMEMNRQFKEIYKNSLRMYWEKQETEIEDLKSLKNEGQEVDHLIARAQYRANLYLTALRSDDISLILKTHDQAQEDNAFDFTPYVYAIVNATQAELDDAIKLVNAGPRETADARQKPFDQLTLVEKLNRFREEFVIHAQPEIIFNPNHILVGLKSNETTWDTLPHASDPEYKMRSVISSQLVGWAQRNAAETCRQDIRQGAYYLTEEKEPRSRPSRFNDWNSTQGFVRNSVVDAVIFDSSVIDGIGYKFASWPGVGLWELLGHLRVLAVFSKLMSNKNVTLGKLIAPSKSHQSCRCAVM